MPPAVPQALLFDLGGVLIDIDFPGAFAAWQRHSPLSLAEVGQRFWRDAAYGAQERGEMDRAAYFRHLMELLEMDAAVEDVERGWNAIFRGQIHETIALVRAVRTQVPCYAFTNTNASHMEVWSSMFPDVVACFERIFASHLIGLRKPDRAAFLHVAAEIGTPPEAIAFFDDSAENVEGARVAGMHAVLVRLPADVAQALEGFRFDLGDRV